MFERYTEKARRSIFFARYEASVFGSTHIDTDHLLLGLMREDSVLKAQLGSGAMETFRKQLEAHSPPHAKVSTSVDLPLTHECRRVLTRAADESAELHQKFIGPGHLVLGLLHIDQCQAAVFLKQNGIHLGKYRDVVRTTPADVPEVPHGVESQAGVAPGLAGTIAALNHQLNLEIKHLDPGQQLRRKPWSRRQAMGHLVDLATTSHEWLARALTQPKFTAAGYPSDLWVEAQRYDDYPWEDLVDLWASLNRLLVHVLAQVPEEKLTIECRIGIEDSRPLLAVIGRYVAECEDLLGQILAKL